MQVRPCRLEGGHALALDHEIQDLRVPTLASRKRRRQLASAGRRRAGFVHPRQKLKRPSPRGLGQRESRVLGERPAERFFSAWPRGQEEIDPLDIRGGGRGRGCGDCEAVAIGRTHAERR